MKRFSCLFLLCGAAFAQIYTTVTVAPNPAASAVGQLRFVEKSNSPTRKYLSFEGPDSLGANVRYKFSGTTTAGCLTVGTLSGSVYPITTTACTGVWTASGAGTGLYAGATAPSGGSNAGLYAGYGAGVSWLIGHDGGAGASLYLGTEDSGSTATSSIYLLGASGILITSAGGVVQSGTVFGGTIRPGTNSAFELGTTAYRWSKVWAGDADFAGALFSGGTAPSGGSTAGLHAGYAAGASWLIGHDGGAGATLYLGTESSGASPTSSISLLGATGIIIASAGGVIQSGTVFGGTIRPSANNTYESGASAYRWSKTWSVDADLSGTITFSGITGATKCLQVNSSGVLSGTTGSCATTDTAQTISGDKAYTGTSRFAGGAAPSGGSSAGLYAGYASGASWLIGHDGGAGATLYLGTESSGASPTSSISLLGATGIIISSAGGVIQSGTVFGGTIRPSANNTYESGASAYRWSKTWSVDADLSGTITFAGITGSTQCLQVNSSGVVSGSGSGCGAGGGGSPVFDSGLVTGQSGSVSVNLTVSGGMAPAGFYRINAFLGCDVGHTSGASQADVFPLFARSTGSAFVEALTPGVNSLRCGSSTSGSAFEFALPPMLVYTDGSAHLQFLTIAVGFASAQLYNYRVYLERF